MMQREQEDAMRSTLSSNSLSTVAEAEPVDLEVSVFSRDRDEVRPKSVLMYYNCPLHVALDAACWQRRDEMP